MKRFLFAIIALMAVVNVKGASVTGALANVDSVTIKYWSVDVQNNTIELSAKIFYKNNKNVDFVMINCHPTITHNAGCPSGANPQLDVVKYMVSENALVVCPDYIGFGETKGSVHPYMCATLTGRNVLDAYKAAIKYVKNQRRKWSTDKIKISPDYYTINVGYSQGGATALAFQRYLETEATDADRDLVNLRGSVCGAGPYDQNIVFDTYEKGEGDFASLDYPIYLLYVLQGHKQAFGETTMRKLELEECFTPDFWAACQGENGFLAKLNAKETDVDALNTLVKNAGFTTFYSIINADYANRDSKVYRTIHKTLEQSNLLAKDGWTPKTPIIFYHDKAGHDIVVPYVCTEAALERFKGKYSYVDAIEDYGYDVDFLLGEATTTKENYLWHAAVFNEIWIDEWKYPLQNTVKGIANWAGQGGYKFTDYDHRTFGARFYAQFLAKRACLRPVSTGTTGNANTNNIDPATPNSQTITIGNSYNIDDYDRVEMALPYPQYADLYTFYKFPAEVDGYYFGADAERYVVSLNGDGEIASLNKMDDSADFEPNVLYLIKEEGPTKKDSEGNLENKIVMVTPALKKNVVACDDLSCNQKEYLRKVNTVDEKSYVTNFLPFAYNVSDGAKAYAMTMPESADGYVYGAAIEGVVPAGEGTLIIANASAVHEANISVTEKLEYVVLTPSTEEGTAVSTNILTGNYDDIDNDEGNFLLFGISNKGNLGFWRWYKEDLPIVKAYTAYIDISKTGPVKGFVFEPYDDETDIEGIQAENAMSVWGIDGTQRPAMQKGLNIVRMSNGTIKKVMVK